MALDHLAAEALRLDTAARLLGHARHALGLMAEGDTAAPALLTAWDDQAVTAREYAEGLMPRQLDLLLAEAPAWTASLLRRQPMPERRAA